MQGRGGLGGACVLAWVTACGPVSGGDTQTGSTTHGAETDGPASQGTTSATSPTSDRTTSPATDGTTAQDGSTGSSTGMTEGSGTSTTSDPFEPLMCRRPAYLYEGCPTDLPTVTAVEGAGATLTLATFGVSVEACMPGNNFHGLAFGDPAAPTAFLYGWKEEYRCGPETWLGEHLTSAYRTDIQPDPPKLAVTLTIEGFAGDWDNETPLEPTRIFGHISGDLVGPFEALRCDLLDRFINNCG